MIDEQQDLLESLKKGDKLLDPAEVKEIHKSDTPTWIARTEKQAIDYQSIRYTVHNSVLLLGSDPMTITESKIIRLIIANVQRDPNRTEFPIYQTTITELAKILHTTPKSLYNEINRISNSLMDRKLYIRYENKKDKWEKYHWVGWTAYDDGVFSIKLSEEIKNFFLDLKGNYTIFEHLDYLMGYKCRYSVSLSEALTASVKRDPVRRSKFNAGQTVRIDYHVDTLRWFTSTQEKYKDIYDLKKRVVDAAVAEINELSEIFVDDYKLERKGATKKVNTFVFYIYDKKQKRKPAINVEVQTFLTDDIMQGHQDVLDETYLKAEFEASGVQCHPDHLEELLKRYKTISEFMEDFTKALQNADHDVIMYLLTIARNKEKTANRIKRSNDSSWDTLELKAEFNEIIEYWNSIATKQEVEMDIAGVKEGYRLKRLGRQDKRVRENYYRLKIEDGETKDSVKKAIDVAAISQFFLRTSGTFSFFMNPKNYFDIASGDRDYDTDMVYEWKMMR